MKGEEKDGLMECWSEKLRDGLMEIETDEMMVQ